MTVTEYVGARYVPIFGRMGETSVQWDNSAPYEPLTIVLYQGNSYTSRQYVPAGIAIDNTDYWIETGNYNAQIEAYRQEVLRYADSFPVDSANILDGAITSDKIAAGAVDGSKVADGSITLGKMSAGNQRNFWSQEAKYLGKNIVFLGDSFFAAGTDSSEQEFAPIAIADALGMTKFNYAVGGAGFGRPTNLISSQQTVCQNAMTATEKLDTALVVCIGGCNDLLNLDYPITQQMIVDGMRGFIIWANETFPNAKVVLVPFNWGFSKLSTVKNRFITDCMNSLETALYGKGCCIVPYAWTWNAGIASRFHNEVHPNQSGYRVIANHILDAIMGSQPNSLGLANDIAISNEAIRSASIHYTVQNGMVTLWGYIRPDQAQTGVGSQIELKGENELAPIVTPNDSILVIPMVSSSTGKNAGILFPRSDGSMGCRFVDVSANEVCCFNITYQMEIGVNWSDYN